MSGTLALRFAIKSHPGMVRPLNEDAVGADPAIGLFVVADGLGGYNAGEIAATMAVSRLLGDLGRGLTAAVCFSRTYDPAAALSRTLFALNAEIFRAALQSTIYEGMATTVIAAWLLGTRMWVAHAGDSRLYRLREGNLEQITKDHSFSQELLDAGMISVEEARTLPAKNLVTRAIGTSPHCEPEVRDYDVRRGDLLLLCSDGLTEMVAESRIRALLCACGGDLGMTTRRLIDEANDAGGRDNCSVILVQVDRAGVSREDDPIAIS